MRHAILLEKFVTHLNWNAIVSIAYLCKLIVFAPVPFSSSQYNYDLPILSHFDPQINLKVI